MPFQRYKVSMAKQALISLETQTKYHCQQLLYISICRGRFHTFWYYPAKPRIGSSLTRVSPLSSKQLSTPHQWAISTQQHSFHIAAIGWIKFCTWLNLFHYWRTNNADIPFSLRPIFYLHHANLDWARYYYRRQTSNIRRDTWLDIFQFLKKLVDKLLLYLLTPLASNGTRRALGTVRQQ